MKLILFNLLLLISVSVLAKDEHLLALSSILDDCGGDDVDTCDSRMIGNSEKQASIISLLRAMKNNDRIKRLYIENYGANEYEKFSTTFKVSINQLTESHFNLESSTSESALFKGEDGDVISIRKDRGIWYLDLDKTEFAVLFGVETGGIYDFIKLFSAAQSEVINLIHAKSSAKEVYRKGGLYYLVAVHSSSDPASKHKIEQLFLKLGKDLAETKREILVK